MRRRDFLKILGATVTAWPSTVRSETAVPIIGYLSALSERQTVAQLAAFRRALTEIGFTEGRNIEIEYRWADGQFQRLPSMAEELVSRSVALIVAQAPPAALAAKAATSSIPIVFVVGFDPVGAGLISSLNRPGGNATGMTLISPLLGEKRLEMLREIAPKARVVAMLANPLSPDSLAEINSVQSAAPALGMEPVIFKATSPPEIDTDAELTPVNRAPSSYSVIHFS